MMKPILTLMLILFLGSKARAEEVYAPFALARRSAPPTALRAQPAHSETVTIPAETEFAVQLLSGMHTQVSHVNDPVKARLLQPLYLKGRLALPAGTFLDGRITGIRAAGRLRRPAELALRFDWISLPDGQGQPVSGVLVELDQPASRQAKLDAEGHLKGSSRFSGKGIAGSLLALGALGAVKGTVAGSAALGALLPAGGAALLGYEFLWPRGQDVHLPPATRCRVRLNYPVTVRVMW